MTISNSFITNFSEKEPHDYYITYHQKQGFGFEKKDLNLGLLGRFFAIFVRIFKRIVGHSYNLESNAKKLAESLVKEFDQISDKAACIKSCFKVQEIVNKWLKYKGIEIISSKQLDQVGKDQLLALYTNACDKEGMKQLIQAGADPNTQKEAIYADLYYFSDSLEQFIIATDPVLGFTRLGPAALLSDKGLTEHNTKVCFRYLERTDINSLDFTHAMQLLKLLLHVDRSRVEAITNRLLKVEATRQHCTELDLALRQNLSYIAKRMLRKGADTACLSQQAKNCLFGIYLDDKNYIMAESMIIAGVDPSCQKNKLSKFLAYAMEEENIDLARLLKRSGAENANPEKSLLCWAVKKNRLDVVQECHQAGDSLQHIYHGGQTLLHLATIHNDLALYDWLSKRVNVTIFSDEDRTAYSYIRYRRPVESDAEQYFLLGNDMGLYFKNRQEADARGDIAMLREKYPATRVDHLLYKVNTSHYLNQTQIVMPQTLASGITVDTLLTHFDSLYPNNYLNRQSLVTLINRIRARTPHIGTPRAGATLELFYHTLECAITHTLKKISEIQDSKKRDDSIKAFVDDFVSASAVCGGRWYATATRHYIAQIRGKEATFQEEILDLLAEFRAVTFETLNDNDVDVHRFNAVVRALGRELGLPGMAMVEQFDDPYAYVSNDQLNTCRQRFKARYSTETILYDQIIQLLEDNGEMREKFIDWTKANIPKNWGNYEQIEHDALKIATRDAQITFLRGHDIYVGKNQTIQSAINEERIAQYMEKELVVDMSAQPMRLQPQAIARMLSAIGVFTPIYT